MSTRNRLINIIIEFANNFELPLDISRDVQGATLSIVVDQVSIAIGYSFDFTQDSYEFGTPIAYIDPEQESEISRKIMSSSPIIGITERIINRKLVILGSRTGLNEMSDTQIMRLFMDDVALIVEAFRNYKDLVIKQ